jgi:O-antigen ligase
MFAIKNYFINEKKIDVINILFISVLPFVLVTRSAFINILTILISLIFLFKIIQKKKNFVIEKKIFYLFLFFWLSLIINSFFSTNFHVSFIRALGFCKFILLVFSINHYLELKNFKYERFIYKSWFFIFLIISADLLLEFFFGFNSLGYQSYMPGRLAGFLNNELKIGNYYFGFILISLSYFYYNHKKYFLPICFLFLFIALAIGERSNFIKIFIIVILFYFIISQNFFIKKIFFLFVFFILLILIGFKNDNIRLRFEGQFLKPLMDSSDIFSYINKTQYGAHYNTAVKIFYNYPVFGSGLKTFRDESSKIIYRSGNDYVDDKRWANHPHQVHFEFLSETGVFGYISFIIFFSLSIIWSVRSYLINKNFYKLSSILFICLSLIPILPTGSFFTTYGATIFFINFAIMISHNKKI